MRITPLDLRKPSFHRRVAGYAPEEVDEFLRLAAEDYESALREIETRREQVVRLEKRVEELSASEQVLQDTLTTAQRLSEDLKRTAMKEAEVMVGQAEIKGEKILDAAHRRAAQLAEDIREMKQFKRRLAAAIRAAIETHLGLLEGLASDPPEDPELAGKVVSLGATPQDARPHKA